MFYSRIFYLFSSSFTSLTNNTHTHTHTHSTQTPTLTTPINSHTKPHHTTPACRSPLPPFPPPPCSHYLLPSLPPAVLTPQQFVSSRPSPSLLATHARVRRLWQLIPEARSSVHRCVSVRVCVCVCMYVCMSILSVSICVYSNQPFCLLIFYFLYYFC